MNSVTAHTAIRLSSSTPNKKGSETEANTRLLLDVENPDNPVEIVIHVNMLKESDGMLIISIPSCRFAPPAFQNSA